MAYRAIYRKWRPIVFEDVVGQKHITDTLKNEIINNKTAHAYLFCGTRGTGKTTTAKILSRAVNCEHPLPDGNPCNECSACKGILNNSVMDVIEIDAASNNGVDNIRELRDDVLYTPSEVKYKVYIIDEVHMLSGGAFNALLKTLEEPPTHVLFILATTEPHKIPATIKSRCQRFDFRRISNSNIAARISEITAKDGINITDDAVRFIAELGDGSMRDALSVLDLCTGLTGEITLEDIENVTGAVSRRFLFDITSSVFGGDISNALSALNTALSDGREVTNVADDLLGFMRELLICKFSKDAENILDKTKEIVEKYKTAAENIDTERLIHSINLLSETAASLKTAGNMRAVLEAALVKICYPECDSSSSAFAARIKRLENGEVVVMPRTNPVQHTRSKPVTEPSFVPPEPPPPQEPPAEQYYSATPQPVEQVQSKTVQPQTNNIDLSGNEVDIKQKLFAKSPYLRVLGENVKFIKQNETMLVVCETKEDMTAANNPLFISEIESVCGCKIRLTHSGEYNEKQEDDPLDEIIAAAKNANNVNLF